MIKLSIVSPTWNHVEQLRDHLESIREQTWRNFEHIIVDNESEDGTESVVRAYQSRVDYPVVYIREPDRGIYQAMNKGIKKARGEWVHVLNSDNAYCAGETLAEVFHRNLTDYDWLLCGVILRKKSGDHTEEIPLKPSQHSALKRLAFPHQGMIVHRDFYGKHGYYSEKFRIVSDSIFITRNYSKARILVIESPIAFLSDGGISGTISLRNTFENLVDLLWFQRTPLFFRLRAVIREIRQYLYFVFWGRFRHG